MVVAPAGCGKTQLIADALATHEAAKPILVLTHTNSGVAALRMRLDKAKVAPSRYRLTTIDAWAIRLINTFPERSGHDPSILERLRPSYPDIREAAVKLLRSGHINDVIAASYSRLLVDEYQDCSIRQHAIVFRTAKILPTCVVGDPVQAIFDFSRDDEICDWGSDVCKHFPQAGELTMPWRWQNAGARALGDWLLDARKKFLAREAVDLSTAPAELMWVQLQGDPQDFQRMIKAGRMPPPVKNGSVLIVSDSIRPQTQQRVASAIPSAITVEAVDLRDLVSFAEKLDLSSPEALVTVVEFAEKVMSNVGGDDLLKRVDSLIRGTARREANDVEQAALGFVKDQSHSNVIDLMIAINRDVGVRAYRPAILRGCIRALQLASGDSISFHEAAMRVREQGRAVGRVISGRAVGSTLTLKGLESDMVVVFDADEHNARNLYVAMTRGSKRLVICSRNSVLTPKW